MLSTALNIGCPEPGSPETWRSKGSWDHARSLTPPLATLTLAEANLTRSITLLFGMDL